jgi:YbgC/YbaW family acyl-CoA thioester hydrolase
MNDSTPAAAHKSDFRFSHKLRVRWAEVDMQKIVFNAHYLMYCDTAITDYWRTLAMPYDDAMAQLGGELFVKKASLEFHGAAHCDDQLEVALKCSRIGNSSMGFTGAIFRGEQLLVTAEIVYVFADAVTRRPRSVPDGLRKMIEDYEAGLPVVTLKTGSWLDLGEDALDVRIEVFVDEQGIPLALETDLEDASALHAVAYNGIGQVVATGRLLASEAGRAKVGRMAVKRVLRGAGQGTGVLRALQAEARRRGDREVMLHAQCSAQGFYESMGYQVRGEVFQEDGLAHVEMLLVL